MTLESTEYENGSGDAGGVAVRVLLPDGGELQEPEAEPDDENPEDAEADEGEQDEGEQDEGEQDQSEGDEESEDTEADGQDDDEQQDEAEGTDDAEEEDQEEEDERERAKADEGARILHLNLDGLFLDLLGLEVDLDTVTLDITAVPGDSKLLGNLLSAVSGALGGNPISNLLGGGGGDEDEGDGSLIGLPSLPDLNPMERAREVAGALADRIRGLFDNVVNALPLEDLLAQFLQEVVSQLLDTGNGDDEEGDQAASA